MCSPPLRQHQYGLFQCAPCGLVHLLLLLEDPPPSGCTGPAMWTYPSPPPISNWPSSVVAPMCHPHHQMGTPRVPPLQWRRFRLMGGVPPPFPIRVFSPSPCGPLFKLDLLHEGRLHQLLLSVPSRDPATRVGDQLP